MIEKIMKENNYSYLGKTNNFLLLGFGTLLHSPLYNVPLFRNMSERNLQQIQPLSEVLLWCTTNQCNFAHTCNQYLLGKLTFKQSAVQ